MKSHKFYFTFINEMFSNPPFAFLTPEVLHPTLKLVYLPNVMYKKEKIAAKNLCS